jgi:hypothetical protein
MAKQMAFALSMHESAARRLRDGARELAASAAELEAIDRLAQGRGRTVDVERLAPLAMVVGLPWEQMWRAFT